MTISDTAAQPRRGHREAGRVWLGCEEVWCLDTDGIPNPHEMGVSTAAAWGELFERVGAEQWPALFAWVDSGCHVTEADDIPDAATFEERYRGRWDSWTEYADMVAEETDLMDKWPEEAKRYFNWAAWRRDLAHDYTVVDAGAPDYGVHVFSNN